MTIEVQPAHTINQPPGLLIRSHLGNYWDPMISWFWSDFEGLDHQISGGGAIQGQPHMNFFCQTNYWLIQTLTSMQNRLKHVPFSKKHDFRRSTTGFPLWSVNKSHPDPESAQKVSELPASLLQACFVP